MEVYLIRHTTPKIEKGVCYGQSDVDVTDSFEEETNKLLMDLPDTFDMVFTSPLKRCLKLANQISVEAKQDDRLMEVNFGNWELKKWDEISEEVLNEWMQDFVNVRPPNGESAKELFDRTTLFYEELMNREYQRVAIVTHLGVIRMLNSFINNVSIEKSFMEFNLRYGGFLRVK